MATARSRKISGAVEIIHLTVSMTHFLLVRSDGAIGFPRTRAGLDPDQLSVAILDLDQRSGPHRRDNQPRFFRMGVSHVQRHQVRTDTHRSVLYRARRERADHWRDLVNAREGMGPRVARFDPDYDAARWPTSP